MSICRSVSDSKAREICQELTRRHPLTLKDFDQGTEEIRFDGPQPTLKKVGASDGKISSQEVYQKAIEIAENDSKFLKVLIQGRKLEIPWKDEVAPFRTWVEGKVTSLQKELNQDPTLLKGFTYQKKLGKRLFQEMMRPASEGGLGLFYDNTSEQRSLEKIYKDRGASCLDFVILYLKAAEIAHLPAVPLQLFYDREGRIQHHVRIGLKNPETRKTEVIGDISLNYFGDPLEKETWLPISRLELLAHFYNSRAVTADDNKRAEKEIDRALKLSPGNFLFQSNKAYYLYQRKQWAQARRYLLDSLQKNPYFPDTYSRLYRVSKALNDESLAQ